MKNFLLVLIVASATFFGSCSKDDEPAPVPKPVVFDDDMLLGSWVDNSDPGRTAIFEIASFQGNTSLKFELNTINSNNTFFKYIGKWLVKDNDNLELYDMTLYNNSTTGSMLSYKYNFKLIELTSTSLKWEELGVNNEIITRSFKKV